MRNGIQALSGVVTCLCMMFVLSGCAQTRYRYGVGKSASYEPQATVESRRPISIGGYHPRIDRIEAIVQAPARLFKKQFGKVPGDKTEKTPEQLRHESLELIQLYLSTNGLDDVYIDVECYEPSLQWSRLRENDSIAPIWKYTGGTLSVIR